MDIDTSTVAAARRNLVLISMVFILFSFGEIPNDSCTNKATITTLVGSIAFEQDVIIKFAWVMFSWFLLRFWQFSNFADDWRTFTLALAYSKLMSKWLESKGSRITDHDHVAGQPTQPFFGDWVWNIRGIDKQSTYTPDQLCIPSKKQVFKKLLALLYVSITTEHFGQYYFPYCLALAAILMNV